MITKELLREQITNPVMFSVLEQLIENTKGFKEPGKVYVPGPMALDLNQECEKIHPHPAEAITEILGRFLVKEGGDTDSAFFLATGMKIRLFLMPTQLRIECAPEKILSQ